MADNKKYYYLKLKENFFDSDEMILLESMPDGYRYSNILLKMYLRSLKDEGRLMLSGKIPYSPEMLATVVRQPVGVVKEALKIFQELGLVSVLDTGAIYMMDIQNFIGKSSTEADRIRAYRAKVELESAQPSKQKPYNSNDKCPYKCTPEIETEKEIKIELDIETDRETEPSPVLSAANGIASIFCTAFGVDTISKRLLTSMEQTLQAGVSEQRIASMIHSARNKHPREPESYIAAGLKRLRESAPEEQPVSIKPENQPLEPWEQDWLEEFKAMSEKENSIAALANWHTI